MVSCLLIEPDKQECARVKDLLDSLGMECTTAQRADAVLADPDSVKSDVIVMEASGLPSAKRLLRRRDQRLQGARRAPVVIMYGRETGLDVINETILTGAAEFLVQPFDIDLLRFKLKQSGVLPRRAA
jgi:DNA-binding response OmpR family regulator